MISEIATVESIRTESSHQKIIFFVAEDFGFLNHRLPMARAAHDMGFDVIVLANDTGKAAAIEALGYRFIPLPLKRGGMNIFGELKTLWAVVKIYDREKPTLVHHVAFKPVLYGSIAAFLTRIPGRVNLMAGLGVLFIDRRPLYRLIGTLLMLSFRFLFNRPGTRLIIQNDDDFRLFSPLVRPDKIIKIKGSGVDTQHFSPAPEAPPPLIATLVGRMLWDKGVAEFVDAARLLKERNVSVIMKLVGDPDSENPRTIPRETLEEWHRDKIIVWQPHTSDIRSVWHSSHIAVLPSYREGLPKSLLEAAACGLPLVATDVPGCRELVRSGYNGLLVPVKDSIGLAKAIERLVNDPVLRHRLGKQARENVVDEYSNEAVMTAVQGVYRKILPKP